MRLSASDLQAEPSRALGSVCLVHGHEPLLIEESCDRIRHAAVAAGYTERLSFLVNARMKFDWDQISQFGNSMSLFAERRLLEIRFTGSGVGTEGAKYVRDYLSAPPADTMLLLICGALDKRTHNTAWFKDIDAGGVTVGHAEVNREQLPSWLARRLRDEGLHVEDGVVDKLAFLLEGNLLAAAQEIKKLALLHGDKTLTEADIDAALVDHARFNVFGFIDDCLLGRAPRALRMLAGLRREGVEPIIIIWSLARECRLLAQTAAAKAAAEPASQVFQRLGIWRTRQPLVRQAVVRMPVADWQHAVQRLAAIDRMAKGRQQVQSGATVWDELTRLTVDIAARANVAPSDQYA